MDFDWSEADRAHREELRSFLDEMLPEDWLYASKSRRKAGWRGASRVLGSVLRSDGPARPPARCLRRGIGSAVRSATCANTRSSCGRCTSRTASRTGRNAGSQACSGARSLGQQRISTELSLGLGRSYSARDAQIGEAVLDGLCGDMEDRGLRDLLPAGSAPFVSIPARSDYACPPR
jgi:hypothetical protein